MFGEYIDHCLITEDKTLRIIIMNDIVLIKTEENIACGILKEKKMRKGDSEETRKTTKEHLYFEMSFFQVKPW